MGVYYNFRPSAAKSLNESRSLWEIHHLEHPIQTDHFNCGVFVINFIKEHIHRQQNIVFDASATSLAYDRQLISSAFENGLINQKINLNYL